MEFAYESGCLLVRESRYPSTWNSAAYHRDSSWDPATKRLDVAGFFGASTTTIDLSGTPVVIDAGRFSDNFAVEGNLLLDTSCPERIWFISYVIPDPTSGNS